MTREEKRHEIVYLYLKHRHDEDAVDPNILADGIISAISMEVGRSSRDKKFHKRCPMTEQKDGAK